MKAIKAVEVVDEFGPATLGHAAQEAENDVRPIAAEIGGQATHFVECFLLGEVPDAAGVEEDDVGVGLGGSECIPFGNELGGNGFAVALIHLAAVSFYVNAWHLS